jgi:excisionase family DNA binding protein
MAHPALNGQPSTQVPLPQRAHARATPGEPGPTLPTPLLDADQAAVLLNVPPSWVREQARRDRIPWIPLGRYMRFDAAELEVWWRKRARGPWRSRGAAARAARGVHAGSEPAAEDDESA